jgi:hypothetical protein
MSNLWGTDREKTVKYIIEVNRSSMWDDVLTFMTDRDIVKH